MPDVADLLLGFVALWPVVTAALWMAGGLLFRFIDEPSEVRMPAGGWPGVTLLIPAYNEESVIATCVRSALACDYPKLEVLVLDDGSTDATARAAEEAAHGDPRLRLLPDAVNRGKADRLNIGVEAAGYDLFAVIDADTHVHPMALRLLVSRMHRSAMVAAVAGAPHVTNRGSLLQAMQVLEAVSIIGLIRRTQSVTGRVGVVAGVLGLFRRDRVLAVGGYDARMATEDIELTWRLLLAGWETVYEPRALVGMQVPSTLRALWAQRKRWARGQGEVLRTHLRQLARWRNHRMWLLGLEAVASLIWVTLLAIVLVLSLLGLVLVGADTFGLALGWGIAIAIVATLQLVVALALERTYDPTILRAFLVAVIYPLAYWMISAAAALRSEIGGFLRGPRGERVKWDLPREISEAPDASTGAP